jgi:hypothetical protein
MEFNYVWYELSVFFARTSLSNIDVMYGMAR